MRNITMTAFEYCKKYTISQAQLEILLNKTGIKSDYLLSGDELNVYQNSIKPKINGRGGRKKKGMSKPNPWNLDNLKKRPWIIKK